MTDTFTFQNFIGGSLDADLSDIATTMSSPALEALAAVSGGATVPIVLDPDGIRGEPEVVYITAHTALATTATIEREPTGESSTARAHKAGIEWVHTPTAAWLNSVATGSPTEMGSLLSGVDSRYTFNAQHGEDEGYDEEFDQVGTGGVGVATLPTGWSWINQGAAIYEEQYGHGRIDRGSGDDGTALRGIVQDLPAGLQSFELWSHLWGMIDSGSSGYLASLIFRRSANGDLLQLGYYWDNAGTLRVYANHYTDENTFGSTLASVVAARPWAQPHIYFHIYANSPTDWDLYYNYDGGCDFGLDTALDVSSVLGGVPDQIGFAYNAPVAGHVGCEWIRIRDIVTA